MAILFRLQPRYNISKDWVGNVRVPQDGQEASQRSPEAKVEQFYKERWKDDRYRT